MVGSSLGTRPNEDEIEISLFGPGYGESLLLHLGLDYWVVIDSCLSSGTDEPAPIRYLKSIGVDPAQSIRLVLATHWHDDHIGGISDIFSIAQNAKFFCSAALRASEFSQLVEFSKSIMTDISGASEFSRIMNVLEGRGGRSRKASIGPEFVLAGQILDRRNNQLPYEIHALSPSSASLSLAFTEISDQVKEITTRRPGARSTKRRIVAQGPNNVAIVLWVKIGETAVLLGSDLEETANPNTGWTVIVDSAVRPSGKAEVFKVPHHGSSTSYQPRVWQEMVETQPLVVVAPFLNGRVLKPSVSEVEQILFHTTHAYITSPVKRRQTKWASNTIEKTIKETVIDIREVPRTMGQVRLRKKHPSVRNEEWQVDLLGAARDLKLAHA